jgi:dihydropteroate synthase
MGILNVTPDSFSDGGLFLDVEKAVQRAEEMRAEGAQIIDIGGESTRPGAEPVSLDEELQRVAPAIKAVRKRLGREIGISVDTYKSGVAEAALAAGADIINSLGGFQRDQRLVQVVATAGCPIMIYHIKGEPKTMQQGEILYRDVIQEVSGFFEAQIALALAAGAKREQFILDPGVGFGKTVEQNLEMIRRFDEFGRLNLPLAIGVSRKSHLGVLLGEQTPDPLARLEAALAETAVAVQKGARIVRTHDVLATKKFVRVIDQLK